MMTKAEILARMGEIKARWGEWRRQDIELPYGVWTRGDSKTPIRLVKRLMENVDDLLGKPLSASRVLDLAVGEGATCAEFALQGAEVVAVEARDENLARCRLLKDAWELDNLELIKDDVRNVSREKYGEFDVVCRCGILYHLPAGILTNSFANCTT